MTREEVFRETPTAQLRIESPYVIPGLKYRRPQVNENPAFIIGVVLDHFKLKSLHELISRSRKRKIVYPRQICFYLLSKYSRLTMGSIGDMFGGKDHTTVIHGRETIKDLMDTDTNVFEEVSSLCEKITVRSYTVQMSKTG